MANDENVDTTNDAMIMMTNMIMIMSKMMKTMMMMVNIYDDVESLIVNYFWMMTPLVMAMDGVNLLMSNDKMMSLTMIMKPAVIMMIYTVQVGGAGCEGAAQLRVCLYRGGGKEARPKENPAR